jgi:tRNA(Arg) A34 adenosine deaminase TadA
MTLRQQREALVVANQEALLAKNAGHHPFAAILVAPDGFTILDRQGNIDTVNHAEATLARRVASQLSSEYLWHCTLVTTVEPCAMCAGTQYWANIGNLLYGLSERQLLSLTGNHAQNPTMDLPCRTIFAAGQKAVTVTGPLAQGDTELEQLLVASHRGAWR